MYLWIFLHLSGHQKKIASPQEFVFGNPLGGLLGLSGEARRVISYEL